MRWPAAAALCLLCAVSAEAQDSVVEITEAALNKIVRQLGSPSDGGVFLPAPTATLGCTSFGYLGCPPSSNAPPGSALSSHAATERVHLALCREGNQWRTVVSEPPVVWQWWVTDARFYVRAGRIDFDARVHTRVGDTWGATSRGLDATVDFDPGSNRLRLNVQPFRVPLTYSFQGTTVPITEVDVGKLFSLSLPLEPQQLRIPTPHWPRLVNARTVGATAQYEPGLLRINLELAFQ